MSSTVNKGLDKAKQGVTKTGDGISSATDYVGDKLTGKNIFKVTRPTKSLKPINF